VVREFSAGGICVRRMQGREWVAAIRVKDGKVLALPKGNIDPGETAAEAARREVREEAGVDGELVDKLGDVKYWYVRRGGERVFKVVSFFLLRYRSGSVQNHDHEVDAAEWVPLEDAERLLEYKGEKQMAAAAHTALAESR
jgi:8-oxo-dGTP pyrophosphatase MutT (NUDIX family)